MKPCIPAVIFLCLSVSTPAFADTYVEAVELSTETEPVPPSVEEVSAEPPTAHSPIAHIDDTDFIPATDVDSSPEPETPETLEPTVSVIPGKPPVSIPDDRFDTPDRRPFGKGTMELSIGLGGGGGGGSFLMSAGVLFAYYLVDRLAPGLDVHYQATISDQRYPQSLTLFPLLKYVLIRSHQFAPYLMTGGGRNFQWAGTDRGLDTETGRFHGYPAVSSWLYGVGGGAWVGLGARAGISIQILAMYRRMDEPILQNAKVVMTQRIVDNRIETTYELEGDRTDAFWYPAPSFWFSLRL